MSSYAIIIGINHYTPPNERGLRPLNGAIRDAQEIYNWITGPGGVPVANCALIQSTQAPLDPIKTKVDRAIANIMRSVVENDNKDADRLYFYFAGHGMGVEIDRENNGMCMADWDEYMRDAATISSSEYKKKFINEGLFKEVVMWMDCCRTTQLYLNPQGSPGIVPIGPNNKPRIMVAFATEFRNEAFEAEFNAPAGTETRGIFTKVLLEGLTAKIPKTNGFVDGIDLINHLDFFVGEEAQSAGFSQDPEIYSNLTKARTIIF
jgi:uncharacterized caspase-like protein